MPNILTSLHGRLLGLLHNGSLAVGGPSVWLNNVGATPVRAITTDASVACGSALQLTVEDHSGKEILLDTLAGSLATLPAATGSKAKFRFRVSVLATSNSHKIQVANASDTMAGIILGTRVDSGNAVLGFAAAASSDTITLNRTTTGSVTLGEWIEVEDVAANLWHVKGVLSATGAAFATPFSAAV